MSFGRGIFLVLVEWMYVKMEGEMLFVCECLRCCLLLQG